MGSALKFVTSRGQEIILDNFESERTIWELYGRTGFAAPPVQYVDALYADGYSETLAVRIEPRDITLRLIVRGSSMAVRDSVLYTIMNQLLEQGTQTVWGKLYLRRADGIEVYLNCFYSGGLESQSDSDPLMHLMTLNFHAPDPFFYDQKQTEFYFADTEQDGLYLSDSTYFGEYTYLSGGIRSSETIVKNTGQITYPVITIVGPAKNIKLENLLSGKTIELEEGFVLLTGESLIIDCRDRKRSIMLRKADNTATDITDKLRLGSSLVFPLLFGDNNIKITYTDTTAKTSVNFAFQKRYLSA